MAASRRSEKRTVRILHVASFSGNIGDNASHSGTYRMLEGAFGGPLEVDRLEIRETYLNYVGPNRWRFDEEFIREANRHDLTLVGGGNYFELWVESSATGTTVDLDPSLLRQLRTPLVFNALGCDPLKGYSTQSLQRFRAFLRAAIDHKMVLVSVRNDGSAGNIDALVGTDLLEGISVIPDPGFFVSVSEPSAALTKERPYWVVSMASDMPGIRFGVGAAGSDSEAGYQHYIRETAAALTRSLEEHVDLQIVLAPHIYSDLQADADTLNAIPDSLRRTRVAVAPYGSGPDVAAEIFGIYRSSELVLGTRFHANVCAIGLGVPSIGLVTYQKVADMYEALNLSDRYLWCRADDSADRLHTSLETTQQGKRQIRDRYVGIAEELHQKASKFYRQVAEMTDRRNT